MYTKWSFCSIESPPAKWISYNLTCIEFNLEKLKQQLQPTKGFIRHQTPHPKRPSCVAPIHRESSLPDQILRPYRVNRGKQMILHEAVQHHREVEQDCRGFSATKNSKNLKHRESNMSKKVF